MRSAVEYVSTARSVAVPDSSRASGWDSGDALSMASSRRSRAWYGTHSPAAGMPTSDTSKSSAGPGCARQGEHGGGQAGSHGTHRWTHHRSGISSSSRRTGSK